MSRIKSYREPKLGYPVVLSLTFHILVYAILAYLHVFSSLKLSEAPVYYVDLLNLPVAEPRAGSPTAATSLAPPKVQAAPAPPTPQSRTPEMKLPVRAPEKPTAAKPQPAPKAETSREFEDRLARLERDSEAKHAAAAIEALQKKTAAGRTGVPGGKGTQAGSDYSGFIRSRLEDAFRKEDTFKRDRSKMVAVRLVIGVNGRIGTIWVDRESSDKMFNDAVLRAIHRAEKEFVPPPGGMQVELGFVFKPQEVGKK